MGDIIVLSVYALFMILLAVILTITTYMLISPLLPERTGNFTLIQKIFFLSALIYPVLVITYAILYIDGPRDAVFYPMFIINLFIFLILSAISWTYRKRFALNHATSITNLLGASFNAMLLLASMDS